MGRVLAIDRSMTGGVEEPMPYLHFHAGERPLFAQPLRGGRMVIGRSDACDVALPGNDVSRVHAVFEERDGGWWVVDRSRHGVRVNGLPVDRRQRLMEGDVVHIGEFRVRYWQHRDDVITGPTTTGPSWTGVPEDVVEVDGDAVTTSRAVLQVVRGPAGGSAHVLRRTRMSVGGAGADVVLERDLPSDAFFLRVARGRVMVEPGSSPVRLAGQLVRELTPALRGEQIDVGPHALLVEVEARSETREVDAFGEMVGTSASMRKTFGILERLARHDYPVLLLGESGTGKELAARALHGQSHRSEGPFVAVNCAAIASSLFESELFGHEKGAFTGADSARDGAFQRASGGVLFLDEVGELGLDVQAKLLRALEPGGEVRRVGGSTVSYPDVRVVAATNRDLAVMVRAGKFRSDLYHRLNMLTVRLPPLRERGGDVVPLAEALLRRHHPGATLEPSARAALEGYAWPGNVRELRNVLLRAYVLAGDRIEGRDLEFFPDCFDEAPEDAARAFRVEIAKLDPEEIERAQLVSALEAADGNRSRAARALGVPRSSLLYKLKRFGLE